MLAGVPLADLQRAASMLSRRYRAEVRDGRLHLDEALAVKAYLAARLPATYAAVRSAMQAAADRLPDFSPQSLLDFGSGPGTALWAAADCWPGLRSANLVEASQPARAAAESLAGGSFMELTWIAADIAVSMPKLPKADLVTIAYVLDELPPASIADIVHRLWALTEGLLLVVEPGTPAGWSRICLVRDNLIKAGATIAAPCAHDAPCPLSTPDWCHFARRVARSRTHRLVKSADVPWEDEKFAYVAATRINIGARPARVLAPPRAGSGKVQLKLCQPDGRALERLFTKRDGAAFKLARRADWGDAVEEPARAADK